MHCNRLHLTLPTTHTHTHDQLPRIKVLPKEALSGGLECSGVCVCVLKVTQTSVCVCIESHTNR